VIDFLAGWLALVMDLIPEHGCSFAETNVGCGALSIIFIR